MTETVTFHIPMLGVFTSASPAVNMFSFPYFLCHQRTAKELIHRIRHKTPAHFRIKTSPEKDPLATNRFPRAKVSPFSKATTTPWTSSPRERHSPPTLGGDKPPPRLSVQRMMNSVGTYLCDPSTATSSHLPRFFFRSFFFPL